MTLMNHITKLVDKISNAKIAYYNGSSIISDDEYDLLVEELIKLDPNNKLITDIGAEPNPEWRKEKHLFPLGSLNKTNSLEELHNWFDKYGGNKDCILVEKLDGLSIGAQYEKGKLIKSLLRGNAIEGENILSNFVKMIGVKSNVSDDFTGIIRGEIVLTNSLHQKHFTDYSNPRNAASGLCRRLDGIGCEYLSVYFYQVIGNLDFKSELDQLHWIQSNKLSTPNYYHCQSIEDVWKWYSLYIKEIRSQLDYWIDGLVVSCNDIEHQKLMGELHHRPRSKIALKFPNQLAKTQIQHVEWQVGNSGRITPVATFTPVDLLGSTVERASLYNIAYIKELNLGINSIVMICKANEIIPRVESVITSGDKIEIPNKCPSCGNDTIMNGENLHCTNTDICPAQVFGRIQNWISALNILEWGDKLLLRLIEQGMISTIVDLYKLSIEDLSELERMGVKSATKCHTTLWSINPIDLDVFLGGLSIPLVGASTIQMLIKNGVDTLTKIRQASYESILEIKGLGPGKAKSLFEGLKRNSKLIDELLDVGLKIKELNNKLLDSKLNGKTICITGSTNIKRDDLIKIIKDNGGLFKDSISKTCSHLIIADINSTSKKAVSAKKMGITLLTEEDFFQLLN